MTCVRAAASHELHSDRDDVSMLLPGDTDEANDEWCAPWQQLQHDDAVYSSPALSSLVRLVSAGVAPVTDAAEEEEKSPESLLTTFEKRVAWCGSSLSSVRHEQIVGQPHDEVEGSNSAPPAVLCAIRYMKTSSFSCARLCAFALASV
jgi:hypothetical protein